MLRRIRDMPAGTVGFEAIGEVEDDDWEEAVEPILRSEMAEGQKIRLLYLLGPEARDPEGDAIAADTGLPSGARQCVRPSCSRQRRGLDAPGSTCAVGSAAGKARGFPSASWKPDRPWVAEGLNG